MFKASDRQALVDVIEILNKICDGKPVSLTAGRRFYLIEVLRLVILHIERQLNGRQ